MAADSFDQTDMRILEVLQQDGRASYAELARAVSMSASTVTERVRRLEDRGIITGYSAVVDPERLGLGVTAFVRLRYPTGNYKPFLDLLATKPETIEAHHVTGEDCFVLTVLGHSMRHLEATRAGSAGWAPSRPASSTSARSRTGRSPPPRSAPQIRGPATPYDRGKLMPQTDRPQPGSGVPRGAGPGTWSQSVTSAGQRQRANSRRSARSVSKD